MSHHEHHDCSHTVSYCKRCDTCYCTQCRREWGRFYANTWTYYPTTTTGTGTATIGNVTTMGECNHGR